MNIPYSKLLFWERNATGIESMPPLARPARDWNLILAAGAFAALLLVGFAVDMYWWSIQTPAVLPPANAGQLLLPQQLDVLLSHYDALAEEHALLLQQAPAIADPAQSK